jgi:hypothetical protein
LRHSGLIQVIVIEEKQGIPEHQLPSLEKMARLYYEMDINIEVIETINYLVNRINEMQKLITKLNKRPGFYED